MIKAGWKTYKIKDIAKVVNGGTPKTKISKYWNGNIPWLTPKDLTGYNKIYIGRGERNITKEGLNNSSAKLLPQGTVLLTSRAPIGYVAVAKNDISTNQGFKNLIINSTFTNNIFIFYWIKNNVDYLKSLGTGTTFGELNKSTFENLEIELPPLPEQRAIAEVLSSLDDKIDLLHRQNKTLEQMAETLFRQWFIEEAKEDWEETTLGNLIKIGSGKGLKKDKFVDNGKYPILGANGEIGRTNEYLFDNRLIFTGRVGTLGNVFRVENEKVWLSDNTLIIEPIKYYNYIYFVLKNEKLSQYNVGSTQPLVRQSDIKEIEIRLTKEKTHIEFETKANLFFNKIYKNQQQIRTLEKLRDTLLPKLMNGEVRVKSRRDENFLINQTTKKPSSIGAKQKK